LKALDMGRFHTNFGSLWRRAGRRRATLALASSYSRFVGLMKVALPATAVALLGLIIAWPHLVPRDKAFRLAFADIDIKSVDTLSMTSPRYYGTDDKNQPFTVTAESGTQLDSKEQVVALERPLANISRDNGANVVVNSDTGFFRQKENTLEMLGHVDLFQDNGYEVHTNSAHIDIQPGNARGDEPTVAQGPSGTVEGEGFRLWNKGQHIIFTGKVKAVLNMTRSRP
jgi:lipopolysaccharide export system protein LptC